VNTREHALWIVAIALLVILLYLLMVG